MVDARRLATARDRPSVPTALCLLSSTLGPTRAHAEQPPSRASSSDGYDVLATLVDALALAGTARRGAADRSAIRWRRSPETACPWRLRARSRLSAIRLFPSRSVSVQLRRVSRPSPGSDQRTPAVYTRDDATERPRKIYDWENNGLLVRSSNER